MLFANPHLLSQNAKVTTRSEIADDAGYNTVASVGDNQSLKHELDNLLRETWADALANTSTAKVKSRKTTETGDDQLMFRLVSNMRPISLGPRPLPPSITREPECEDNEAQAEVRGRRARSAAVEFNGETHTLTQQTSAKPSVVETKVPLANMPLSRHLPPLFVIEEVRAKKQFKTQRPHDSEHLAASPHEPRLSCVVLPVKSVSGHREMPKKRRRKAVRERPAPAYWRPSPDMRGKCPGYALGYPSNWASDRLYVRDTMKRGVGST